VTVLKGADVSPILCGAHLYLEGSDGETCTIECEKPAGHDGPHAAHRPNNGEAQVTWPEDERQETNDDE